MESGNKKRKDIKGVISRQKRYSTLAREEGKYAKKKESEERKKGLKEMASDSSREAKIAFSFAKKRQKIVRKEEKKLRKK